MDSNESKSPRPHEPVLLKECLRLLDPQPGQVIVDVTAGAGGHLRKLAEAVGPSGRVIALDRDPRAHLDSAAGGVAKEFTNITLVRAPFEELEDVLAQIGMERVDGLLADLGISSMQIDEEERGFSFLRDGPVDMRMDPDSGESALEMIARLSESELADLIYQYGDERRSRRIARALKSAPIANSTSALAERIARAMPGPRGRIHPATRTFQALRIGVNRELEQLDTLMDALSRVLKPGGRAAVISFHSLEDRRVKVCFRDGSQGPERVYTRLTKKPIVPTSAEMRRNARARSAKLRGVERCA